MSNNLDYEEQREAAAVRIAFNKEAIVTALRGCGITGVEVEYSGEGDSGNGISVSTTPTENVAPLVTMRRVRSTYDSEKRAWNSPEQDQGMTLDDALQELLDDLITQNNHDGWENGDGGGGTLTIDVESNSYELAHYDNIVDQSYSHHAG